MIPFSWLLLAWLGMLTLFALLALVTLFTYIRYSVANTTTYFSTFLFLGVAALVLVSTWIYLLQVDWSQNLDISPMFSTFFTL